MVLALEVSNIKDGGKFSPNVRLNCGTVDVRISEDPISFCWYIGKLPNYVDIMNVVYIMKKCMYDDTYMLEGQSKIVDV